MLQILLKIAIVASLGLSLGTTHAQEEQFLPSPHVVLDLDWTLFYKVNPHTQGQEVENIVEAEGEFYRLADFGAEFIAALHRLGVRVSTFSGGTTLRNMLLVDFLNKKVREQKAKNFSFYKVLNKDDMTRLANAIPTTRFVDAYRKDLTRIIADDLKYLSIEEAMNRVLLLDDVAKFAMTYQEGNLLHLTPSFEDILNFDMVKLFPKNTDPTFLPKSFSEWAHERNKFIYLLGVIATAKKYSDRQSVAFVPAVNLLIRTPGIPYNANGSLRARSEHSQLLLLEQGFIELGLTKNMFTRAYNYQTRRCEKVL